MENVQGPPILAEMCSKNYINCKNVQRDLVFLIKPSLIVYLVKSELFLYLISFPPTNITQPYCKLFPKGTLGYVLIYDTILVEFRELYRTLHATYLNPALHTYLYIS